MGCRNDNFDGQQLPQHAQTSFSYLTIYRVTMIFFQELFLPPTAEVNTLSHDIELLFWP